jgi:hypothetical protein
VEETMNDSKRTHEVRVGMSLYWVETKRAGEGYAWSTSEVAGWTEKGRNAALIEARLALQEMERGLSR